MNPIDEYIRKQDETIQPRLNGIRDTIHAAIPDAVEKISYQMPTFWKGRNIIHFAAAKRHIGIYPGAEAVKHFAATLDKKGIKHSKGAIQLPYGRVDLGLVRDVARWCAGHQ